MLKNQCLQKALIKDKFFLTATTTHFDVIAKADRAKKRNRKRQILQNDGCILFFYGYDCKTVSTQRVDISYVLRYSQLKRSLRKESVERERGRETKIINGMKKRKVVLSYLVSSRLVLR